MLRFGQKLLDSVESGFGVLGICGMGLHGTMLLSGLPILIGPEAELLQSRVYAAAR